MEKKAEIITFHCVPNYGAVLQAYAMQQYLCEKVEQVELLDYRPDALMKDYRYINFYSVFSLIHSVISLFPYYRKIQAFKAFEKKYLHLSKDKGNDPSVFTGIQADVVILGSDQIWNPQITGGIDPVYYGCLPWKARPISVAYAASIGKSSAFSETELKQVIPLLEGIDYISVRETEAQQSIQSIHDGDAVVTVDPTILAGAECFRPFVKSSGRKEKYVLLYSLNGYKETMEMAEKLSDSLKLPLVEISGRRRGLGRKKHRTLYSAGPEEFVSQIANADYVVTDSFHGTVFALLFHKEFMTIPHKQRGGRLTTLLDMCGLQNRIQTAFNREILQLKIDWDSVDERIEQARERSVNYLNTALKPLDRDPE